jgi:Winged helix-turn helix
MMPVYFFHSEPGAAELRRLARRESGRVCQRVLMIANMLEGMEHEEAARLAGLSRSAAYEWHNRYEEDGIEGLRDRPRPAIFALTRYWRMPPDSGSVLTIV